MNKIKRLSDILNESVSHEEGTIIEIKIIKGDERAPKSNKKPNYTVNYQKNIDGETIEFDGTLKPYDSGRSVDYNFEVDFFTDDNSENYYDENWEDVEEEILKKFNS